MNPQRSKTNRRFWYEELMWGALLLVLAIAIIWKG